MDRNTRIAGQFGCIQQHQIWAMSNIEKRSVEKVVLNRYWMKDCITIVKIAERRGILHVG